MTFKQSTTEKSTCFIHKLLSNREQKIANRELELLNVAEKIMIHEGFSGFTMDKLVADCNYSKGTVYNHFSNKEDLFCALSIEGMRFLISLMQRSLNIQGTLREKCLGLFYSQRLHSQIHPTSFLCVLMAKTPAVLERASKARLEHQIILEQETTALVDKLLSTAITSGDINENRKQHVESLCFALWSMSFGSNALLINAAEAKAVSRLDTNNALLFNINALLDGIGWKPLSSECDYQQSWLRIGNEVFSKEVSALQE